MEKSDRSMLGSRVASAKRIATDMIPSKTAKPFSTCFLITHFQKNSAKNSHQFRTIISMPLTKIFLIQKRKNGELSLHD